LGQFRAEIGLHKFGAESMPREWVKLEEERAKKGSVSLWMVELTLALFANSRVNETINSMRDSMLALLT